MADKSPIEWTDATWNPVTGCSVVSPGCTNCYAMKLAGTRLRRHASRAGLTRETKSGPVWTGEVRLNEKWLDQPLRWRRPRRIFVCAHGDLFHEKVPDDWIDRIFAVMAAAHWHTFQVLTKRADRMREYFAETWQPAPARDVPLGNGEVFYIAAETRRSTRFDRINNCMDWLDYPVHRYNRFWTPEGELIGRPFHDRPLPNVWLGVSVEDQLRADERIPDLLATPAAVRFLSCEPLLGPVDLRWWLSARDTLTNRACTRVDWIIAGGESGANVRPMHFDWARSLRDQCAVAGVPFFFKQWGNHKPTSDVNGPYMMRASKAEAGRLLDGVEHNGMPRLRAIAEARAETIG